MNSLNWMELAMRQMGEPPSNYIARIEAACDRMTTPCGDGAMVWRIWGSGPTLILLHGGYGSWRHWIRTIPALARKFRLLVPDLPGLGDSDAFSQNMSPEGVASIVTQGLGEILNPDEQYDLIGFSFGAIISGHIAAEIGPKLRSLTIVGAGALGLTRSDIPLEKWHSGLSTAKLHGIHRVNLSRLMIADPTLIDDLALVIQEQNTRMARVSSRKYATSDSLAQALRKSSPRYLNAIWGELDAVAYPHMHERINFLKSLRADSMVGIIPKAGHWVAYEAAMQFNTLITEQQASIAAKP